MAGHLIRSRWVAPMDRPTIEDGAVLIESGRIAAVGPWKELHGGAAEDLGDSILMPGLVNAHTHLELSDCTPGEKPTRGLEQWLTRMLTRTRLDVAELETKSANAARLGAAQCLRFGVTRVGDISRQCHVTRTVLRESPLAVVSFGEVMAMAMRRMLLEERIERAIDRSCEGGRLVVGISPHAPYSVEPDGYRRCLEVAQRQKMPIATHLAETLSEWEFMSSHTGPLKALWDAWLTWDDQVPTFVGGPIAMAQMAGLLEYGALLAHVNYCDDAEMALLAGGRASVVYCPRTHDFLGHPEHRFREMLAMGINVALGTDSCASTPDLNLLEELRLLHRQYPATDVRQLWQMATLNGAKALRCETEAGSLTEGRCADLVTFSASGDDPLRELLENSAGPTGVWVAGAELAKGQGSWANRSVAG